MKKSRLVAFYLGMGTDDRGRMIDDMLSWNDEQLEIVHDYIQWLFPLKEKSAFNSSAPILSNEDIASFINDTEIKHKLLRSLTRLLDFYGFAISVENRPETITKSEKFEKKSRNWISLRNHNFLRITRILKSLVLLNYGDLAAAFLNVLEEIYKDNSAIIGTQTLKYWREAVL